MDQNNTTSKSIVLLAMLLGLLLGVVVAPYFTKKKAAGKMDGKVQEVYDLIEGDYVDNLSGDTLESLLVNGMLAELDPHSHYLTAEELRKETEGLTGGFDGIGVVLRYRGDTVYANEVIAGSPAEVAGVHPGDRILMVGADTVSGVKMPYGEAVKLIRGKRGTVVTLSILRGKSGKPMKVGIVRGGINVPSVPYSGVLRAGVGYIKVHKFGETTYGEFHKALSELKSQFVETVIIDLRGNNGGLLEAAVRMANDLLPNGALIVYTEGAHQRKNETYSRGRAFYEGKVIVMIDEQSASASEVLSGAIQDNDRGTIVGRRSFGKGLVQRQFDMKDGSALWLTVARYYTPSGRCIQRSYDKGTDEYYESYIERMIYEMENDSIVSSITDTTKYYTKQGRVVYGGGGIYPDKVISYLRDMDLIYVNTLFNKGCLSDVALDYIVENYETLKRRYTTADAFVKQFHVDGVLMNRLMDNANKMGIKYNAKSARKYDGFIRTMLKAYIGESIYGTATFYRIYATNDHELKQVLNEI